MDSSNSSKKQKTENNFLNITDQKIYFTDSIKRNIRLFELPKDFECKDLYLVGSATEEIVLCNSKNTFNLKKVEISNEVYIIPVDQNTGIFAKADHYYEIYPCQGKTEKVNELLSSSEYPSNAVKAENLYSIDDLLSFVPASQEEIVNAFQQYDIVEINGKLRKLNQNALVVLTQRVFDTLLENQWSLDAVPEGKLAENMQCDSQLTVDNHLLYHVLSRLGKSFDSKLPSQLFERAVWSLEPVLVMTTSAKLVFHKYNQSLVNGRVRLSVKEFLSEWEIMTPGCSNASFTMSLLAGIAILSNSYDSFEGAIKMNASVIYLPRESLRELSVQQRLATLFNVRAAENPKSGCCFRYAELCPYLQGHVDVTNDRRVTELLLMYTTVVDDMYYIK